MPPVKIKYFTADGKTAPVDEWLISLSAKAQTRDYAHIFRLSELGYELHRPEADYLDQGIYELRWNEGRVNYRILYFYHGRTLVILANGLIKEDRIPKRALLLAIERKRLFEAHPDKHTFRGHSLMKSKVTSDVIEIIRHRLAQNPEMAALVEAERNRLAIAAKLRAAREAAGISQQELGRRIGTTQSAIARIESGEYERLTVNTLLKVRSALGKGLGIEI